MGVCDQGATARNIPHRWLTLVRPVRHTSQTDRRADETGCCSRAHSSRPMGCANNCLMPPPGPKLTPAVCSRDNGAPVSSATAQPCLSTHFVALIRQACTELYDHRYLAQPLARWRLYDEAHDMLHFAHHRDLSNENQQQPYCTWSTTAITSGLSAVRLLETRADCCCLQCSAAARALAGCWVIRTLLTPHQRLWMHRIGWQT